ncbi:hypothetical protein EON83_21410 [bacterium]|nr:MAG: hypothetical protein EON83_21410 [bacterium]
MPLRFQTFGAWGVPDASPLAFDLTGANLWRGVKTSGVRRLGVDTPNDEPAPAILYYSLITATIGRGSYTLSGGAAGNSSLLVAAASPFGGTPGVSFLSGKPATPHRFTLVNTRANDEPVSVHFFVEEATNTPTTGTQTEVKGLVWFVRLGAPDTGGVLLRVKDGAAEVCRLAATWTAAGQDSLHTLYALASPTTAQRDETTALEKVLYSQVDSLDGKDTWRGVPIRLTLIPEPVERVENEIPIRRLHVVTEGTGKKGLQTLEYAPDPNAAPLEDGQAAPLVYGAATEVGASGGEWHLVWSRPNFDVSGTLEWGPFYAGQPIANLGDLQTAVLAAIPKDATGAALGAVAFERYEVDGARFGLRATITSTNQRFTPFVHGISARTEPGARVVDATGPTFDTDDLYTRAGESAPREKNPILEVELAGAESGERTAKATFRDVSGNTLGGLGLDDLIGRVLKLENAGGPMLTDGITLRGSWDDLAHFATETTGGTTLRGGRWLSKNKTRISVEAGDGHTITNETLCDPPPVGDGRTLGAQLRALLRICSFGEWQLAGVNVNLGPILPKGYARDGWASIGDKNASVQAAIDGLMSRFGLGLRLYQDEFGVWQFEARPSTIVAAFRTSRAAGRRCILAPLSFQRDTTEFFNWFRVIGGSDAHPIERTYLDKASLKLAAGNLTHARYLGRLKPFATLRDAGLPTARAVNYALRSLLDLHNIPGRRATLESYFTRRQTDGRLFAPRDRVTVDNILCEVLSWQASEARDRLRLNLREVV